MKTSRFKLLSLWLLCVALLTGCVTVPATKPPPAEWSAQRYYSEARLAQSSGNYSIALAHLAELKRRYPDSPFTPLIPLEIAFAHYQRGEYPPALQAAEQFIAQQPQPTGLDYAWYLKGLIQTKLATPPATGGNTTELIPEQGRAAYQSFALLAKDFPDSQYRSEALKQMEQLRNQLANHEFSIIQTLLQQGDQQGALDRADYLIKSYPDSSAASEAQNLIKAAPPSTNSAIHSDAWLLQQNPGHFTIQIAGASSKSWINAFVAKYQLGERIAYYHSHSPQKDGWYTLLYGAYASQDEAEATIPKLKRRLHIDDAWVRQFESIQNAIRAADTRP